ncbi:MAG: hypothetical protein Q8S32_17335 [Burkholderiaceae bacterium]|nr:hypothetical protein [Burkholderiaceae bacterium]
MNPGRRATDAASHAHRRDDDPNECARLHLRVDDPPISRFEWRVPPKEIEMRPGLEDAPRTECADACAFGAFVGALAGCLIGALIILAVLMLGGGQ